MKKVKIGDLSMRTHHITINYLDEAELLKQGYRSPERSFTASWCRTDHSCLRIDIAIVSPKPEQPKRYLSLSDSEAQGICKTIAYLVKTLEEHLR